MRAFMLEWSHTCCSSQRFAKSGVNNMNSIHHSKEFISSSANQREVVTLVPHLLIIEIAKLYQEPSLTVVTVRRGFGDT